MRTPAGFLYLMSSKNTTFAKPPLCVEEQLKLLSYRGLVIQDKILAQHYLKFISYYRFCGYGIEFEDEARNGEKYYHSGTTFEQILDYYVFDRKLRLLVIDAIERIEIAIRTIITNELSLKYGAHWYLDRGLFLKGFKHAEFVEQIKKDTGYTAAGGSIQHKKRERFIQHYFDKYSVPELPPVWMVAEVLSLGTWSMVFANLIDRDNQKIICNHFGISYSVMTSWLHTLTYLRNLCAHHSKLWNRNFTLKPLVANNYRAYLENNTCFAAQAAILNIFLRIVSPENQWSQHLFDLMEKHPLINITKMGFKEGWINDQFWQSSCQP